MRLQKFAVFGLFGLFDHQIPLQMNERITLIHAPNGYGKTVILKMIKGFFGGSLNIFRSVEYKSVVFTFDDGGVLQIIQGQDQDELPIEERRPQALPNAYSFHYSRGSFQETFNPFARNGRNTPLNLNPSYIDRFIPHLSRIDPNRFRDRSVGDIITTSEAIDRYWHQLPHRQRRNGPLPEWLENLRQSVHCRLIETQRLVVLPQRGQTYQDEDAALTPVVKTYAADLAAAIETLLARSATVAQALDQKFPARVVEAVGKEGPPEAYLRQRLSELTLKRSRLAAVALLDSTEQAELLTHAVFNPITRSILSEYIQDTVKKLDVYDDMLSKLELFTSILNARFQFKKVFISRSEGFTFSSFRGAKLAPEMLSSGEQHELVLIYDLLFRTKENSLILIDEPEISLHVAWQRRFLSDLQQVINLTKVDVVISTHSPQLIADQIEHAIVLKAPQNVSFKD